MTQETTQPSGGKRIAKNTLFLYLRMILVLGISLYTSRVVLEILGVTDFGIYNVVAGVVSMLGTLSASLSSATSRFLTYEIGRGGERVEHIFRCSATVHYILAIIVLVLGETVGVWFVMTKLVIPPDRLTAAFWIFQFAIVSVVIRIISTPYNAIIIAYEKMAAFAYISLFEVALQLALIFSLKIIPGDKLIYYGLFLAMTQVIVRILYNIYCNRRIKGANGRWLWHKETSRKLLGFAGWTLFGYGAIVGYTQGINVLLNLFFGPVANAARGFANQIHTGVSQVSSNFQMAIQPPIIKHHAQKNFENMHSLMVAHAKYSFFLVMIMTVPIIINTPYILKLWLNEVPPYTVDFVRLTLIGTLYSTLSGHTVTAVHATGNIRRFQIIEGLLLLTTVPIAYFLLKFGYINANGVLVVYLGVIFIVQFVRVYVVYPMVKMRIRFYFTKICMPIILTLLPVTAYTLYAMRYREAVAFLPLVKSVLASILFCLAMIVALGMSKSERRIIFAKISEKFLRKKR